MRWEQEPSRESEHEWASLLFSASSLKTRQTLRVSVAVPAQGISRWRQCLNTRSM